MNKNQNTIAHVITESGPFGGAQRNTLLTVRGLIRDGYAAELICGSGGPLIKEAVEVGAPVHVMSSLVRPLNPLKDFRVLLQLYQLFRTKGYHIVHTHSVKAGLLGRLAARLAGVPVVVHTVHGVPFRINGDLKSRFYIFMERLLGRITHCFVCVGEILRQEILAWKIAPDEKLTTIYSGIDFSDYVPKHTVAEMKQGLALEGAWPIIGCIGRLSEQKAQHDLIDAVALLAGKYPRIKLLFVGEGPLRPVVEKRIDELSLSSHVFLLGERDDVADLLNVFDVYAMSSRWEGVGRALTEAMYMGLPIVATSVNGVTEVITHEKTGLLVPPGDSRALAASIDRLASDHELAKRLGSNARQTANEIMDSQQMVGAIEELYGRLAGTQELGTRRNPTSAPNAQRSVL